MNVKKFTAATSRDALRKVREALGPDAVILSNRPVDGVVEILALDNDDVAALSVPAVDAPAPRVPQAPAFQAFDDDFDPEPVFSRAAVSQSQAELRQPEFRQAPRAAAPQSAPFGGQPDVARPFVERRAAPEGEIPPTYVNRRAASPETGIDMAAMTQMMSAAIASAKESAALEMGGMMNEIRAMRGLMETQLAELSWNATAQREPYKASVLREMLAAGFSATLARYLIEKMPVAKDAGEALRWIKTVLARNLTTIANEDDLLARGGVFALVGPTGVGKTTTTAKLAARCVMRHGPDKLALITTDAYRIGGHEQLRIYGKILGVMVHSVKDEADLRIALKELKNKHTVLIDTIGMSQRDQMVTEQVAMLSESGADVKRLLCLNATSTGETLNEVVRAYQGTGLAGCIMTKLDEAASIGNVLDVVIRQKLNLHYISNGQRVPEDLHLADRAMLIDRAFRNTRHASAQFGDADLPVMMAAAAHDRLHEVHLG
ncbi:flagellar biosynthesis protein FlhF [Massilia oculi]|uniref:Flagellar biosynthesis protein FlhF n=1 Tax=Massilia hydrophila TaxID=3044279 RepID=A0ABS7Y4Q7_9BURK|nr:flagellar biosynthesis protein FlhF [Massilia oculi]MCA1854636.1 flagellar biosynthesis protein FlhF [Massilia oculi]